MKEIQNQIKHSLATCGILLIAAAAFMTIPFFEGGRAAVANAIGLAPDLLWLPISGILALSLYLAYVWLNATIAKPLNALADHIREGESSAYNLRARSRSKEEIAIKGYIDAHDQKVADVRDERDRFEKELKKTRNDCEAAQSKNDRQAGEIAELDRIQKKLRVESQSLSAANEVLETALETERKTKVGREVKRRTEEIYSQVERAVSEASARAIWIPNLLNKIETPTTLINELTKRLQDNWSDLPLSRIESEIAEIKKQSDLQCVLLETVEPEGILPIEVPLESELEEAEEFEEAPEASEYSETLIGENAEGQEASEEDSDAVSETEPESEATPNAEEIPESDTEVFALAPTSEEEAIESESDDAPEEPVVIDTESIDELPFDSESETAPKPEAIEAETQEIDPDSLSALQALVFELVGDYANEVEKINVDAEFDEDIDIDVDEELLESVLSNLLEIAIYQWQEGNVKLRVYRKDEHITFAVDSSGKPLAYGELDESQNNRIASALDRKIDVDMPSDTELRMRYRYIPEEV